MERPEGYEQRLWNMITFCRNRSGFYWVSGSGYRKVKIQESNFHALKRSVEKYIKFFSLNNIFSPYFLSHKRIGVSGKDSS